jgi:DNA primase large subunit
MLADERLEPILKNMSTAYTGPDYGSGGKGKVGDRVGADDIEGLANNAFPLCMQSLHEAMRSEHHLRHGGRMQYGLFLKGVGLGMEDALVFWSREFSKRMSPEDFLKKYAYNIRHNYGKEGKRADYTPYSCTRIITGTAPGQGDAHGCPYKHWDASRLRSVLMKLRVNPAAVDSIMADVANRDYQIACRKQFEARFPEAESFAVGNHPNGYAEAAIAFLKAKAAKDKEGASNAAAGTAGAGPQGFSATSLVVGGGGGGMMGGVAGKGAPSFPVPAPGSSPAQAPRPAAMDVEA